MQDTSATHRLQMARLLAVAAGLSAGLMPAGISTSQIRTRRARNYPVPQCSSPEEISAWNAKVNTRQVRRYLARHA